MPKPLSVGLRYRDWPAAGKPLKLMFWVTSSIGISKLAVLVTLKTSNVNFRRSARLFPLPVKISLDRIGYCYRGDRVRSIRFEPMRYLYRGRESRTTAVLRSNRQGRRKAVFRKVLLALDRNFPPARAPWQ